MTANNNGKVVTQAQLVRMTYMKLLELEVKFDLLDTKLESLQQDVSRNVFVRSELIKTRFDHRTNELYITEHFKIPFEGNEAALLAVMFKKSTGQPKRTTKFYPAELAGTFQDATDGLKTPKAIHGTIVRIDSSIKHRTMGLEVFKITTKVFYFL
jgi:mRNA-degrading endonuclease HigB of HigAB toxin-antitoxin module